MKRLIYLLALVTVMTGCSPYTLVNSEVYNDANLASYRTFRIVTPNDGHLPPGMEMVTYYNIAAAIREQMVQRGFVEDAHAVMLLNIGLTVHKEIETEPVIPPAYAGPVGPPPPYFRGVYPYYMYPRSFYWSSYYSNAKVITGIYKEGVLSMDIINMAQKIPLYSASVSTILENGDGQFRNLESIAEAVKTLFSRFPVPLLPQYRK